MTATTNEVLLEAQLATAESAAPFGRLIGAAAAGSGRGTRFYGDAIEFWDVPGFRSDEDTCLSVARVQPREPRVLWMERHFKHTQAFISLDGQSFVVVVAPPNQSNAPDPAAVRALQVPAGCGLQLHIGTWHEFPFAIAKPLDLLVILRNETNRNLEVIEDGEAVGEDLEKRSIERRLGVSFVVEMPVEAESPGGFPA